MSTDLHTLSGAYAIDALSPEEAAEFQKHLDACPSCRQEVRELQQAAARMGASEAAAPPAHLKARVLAAADRQPQLPPLVRRPGSSARRAPSWMPRLLSAAAAAVLIVAGAFGLSQLQQPSDVERVFEAGDAEVVRLSTANGGEIRVAMSESLGEMAVDTDQLPALAEDRVYQLWAIADGEPKSAGVLEDPDEGAAMELPEPGALVAVTVEPAGGSELPTSEPIVIVSPNEI